MGVATWCSIAAISRTWTVASWWAWRISAVALWWSIATAVALRALRRISLLIASLLVASWRRRIARSGARLLRIWGL